MTGLETAGAVASIMTACVTMATLGVLIWYTIETHKLRLEAQRQNENSMMPIVMFQSVYTQGQHAGISRLVIRNLGSGPAFNVYVGPMEISGKPAQFEYPRMLSPGQENFVSISGLREAKQDSYGGYDDGKIHNTRDLLQAVRATPEILETNGVITYTSASGKKYGTTFTIDHRSGDTESFIVFGGLKAL